VYEANARTSPLRSSDSSLLFVKEETAVSLNDLVPQMNEVAGAASWGRLNVIGIDLLSK
jgi:hypothetical protein